MLTKHLIPLSEALKLQQEEEARIINSKSILEITDQSTCEKEEQKDINITLTENTIPMSEDHCNIS